PRSHAPYSPELAVTLHFSLLDLEPGADFLAIHNGPDATAPVIALLTGNQLPPPITSTADGGALTVALQCDELEWGPWAGWAYTVECGPAIGTGLAGEAVHGPSLWPNPATDRCIIGVRLSEPGPVEAKLLDAQGRTALVLRSMARHKGPHEIACGLEGLAPGVYVALVTTPSGIFSARIVRR
ncbi:MAG: hypothetical protein ACK4L7_05315, partial [Flavobacteriales bacterium]